MFSSALTTVASKVFQFAGKLYRGAADVRLVILKCQTLVYFCGSLRNATLYQVIPKPGTRVPVQKVMLESKVSPVKQDVIVQGTEECHVTNG